jgi:hypothetical protein
MRFGTGSGLASSLEIIIRKASDIDVPCRCFAGVAPTAVRFFTWNNAGGSRLCLARAADLMS